MTQQRRYAAQQAEIRGRMVEERLHRRRPVTVPWKAIEGHEITWRASGEERPPVWVWVQYDDRSHERLPAIATAWSAVSVTVDVVCDGTLWQIDVWRSSVRMRGGI